MAFSATTARGSLLVCLCLGVLPSLADDHGSESGIVHTFNQDFLDGVIRSKDSRTFLNDLINRIQLLLNESNHTKLPTEAVKRYEESSATPLSLKQRTVGTRTVVPTQAAVTQASASANATLINDTVADMILESKLKKLVADDGRQKVATLGVLICLTFVGTATCIIVMAFYSSKFSGIILLSNGRWWCPMVTRGSGVERQYLV